MQSVIDQLPAGEHRDGQLQMCDAVEAAIATGEHLVVEAGTGVGKSLAYLLPAVLCGYRVVVATARKPLQDQLIRKDIPFLAGALPGRKVDAAVLKGRSNYVCLAKLDDAMGSRGQGQLVEEPGGELGIDSGTRRDLGRLAEWARGGDGGDLADVPFAVSSRLRALATVSARECPGAETCPQGEECLGEAALQRAREAALVVTNTDLYCLDLLIGGGILGPHDVVVIDEAHEMEDIAARTIGLELGRGRLNWFAAQLKGLLASPADAAASVGLAGERLAEALAGHAGRRVDLSAGDITAALVAADTAVEAATGVLRKITPTHDRQGRHQRTVQAATSLLDDLRTARAVPAGHVAWVTGGPEPALKVAPVDVGPVLAGAMFSKRTVVLTSATLSVGGDLVPLATRLGLRPDLFDEDDDEDDGSDDDGGKRAPAWRYRTLRVTSPFDYRTHALLYCARHLPDPRRSPATFDAAAVEELAELVEAAEGRTLALFTSHRMLRMAASALEGRFPWTVLVQDGPPQPALVDEFRRDEHACLLATMGYWQGVDIAGPSLSLVVIDRLPFPRPDDPLLSARREAVAEAGRNPFAEIDLAHAAKLLAQGAGRLVRSAEDRGVVAVLDRRLAVAGYRPALLDSMPPMKRTVDGTEARRFLSSIAHSRSG